MYNNNQIILQEFINFGFYKFEKVAIVKEDYTNELRIDTSLVTKPLYLLDYMSKEEKQDIILREIATNNWALIEFRKQMVAYVKHRLSPKDPDSTVKFLPEQIEIMDNAIKKYKEERMNYTKEMMLEDLGTVSKLMKRIGESYEENFDYAATTYFIGLKKDIEGLMDKHLAHINKDVKSLVSEND